MKPGWINTGMIVDGVEQPKGFDIYPIRVETRRLLPDRTIYRFELMPDTPLTFIHPDGRWMQPCKLFETDQGSVPWLMQRWIPKDRFIAFYLHDSSYLTAYAWTSFDHGETWGKQTLTRREADAILKIGTLLDPAPATERQARAIWLGVRLGGWAAWLRKIRKNYPIPVINM